jgi:hemerythrin-like metal-binding protein
MHFYETTGICIGRPNRSSARTGHLNYYAVKALAVSATVYRKNRYSLLSSPGGHTKLPKAHKKKGLKMARGQIPEWIYESLPYVYIVAGGIAVGTLQNFPGILSGVLLVSAGVLVVQQRKYYRSKLKREIRRERELGEQRQPTRHSGIEFTWQPAFEVGNEVIDRQHRRLFFLASELFSAVMLKHSTPDIELMLDEMICDIEKHFASEEEIMAKAGHPLSKVHLDIHADLLVRLKSLRDRFHDNLLPAQELIGFITYDVISQHIAKEDLKFADSVSH